LSDGTTDEFYANIIAENLFSQVDSEGKQYVLMKEICDHRRDDMAVPASEGWRLDHHAERPQSAEAYYTGLAAPCQIERRWFRLD
jgi:hypothetical protein